MYYRKGPALLRLLSMVLSLIALPVVAQTTYSWTGTTGSWHQSSNWTPSGIPGANDRAEISSGTVNLNSPANIKTIWMQAGTLQAVDGFLTISDSAIWEGGTLGGADTVLVVNNGANLVIQTNNSRVLDATLLLNGEGEWTSGSIGATANGIFINNSVFRALSVGAFGSSQLGIFDNQPGALLIVDSQGNTTISGWQNRANAETRIHNPAALRLAGDCLLTGQLSFAATSGAHPYPLDATDASLIVAAQSVLIVSEDAQEPTSGTESFIEINGGTVMINAWSWLPDDVPVRATEGAVGGPGEIIIGSYLELRNIDWSVKTVTRPEASVEVTGTPVIGANISAFGPVDINSQFSSTADTRLDIFDEISFNVPGSFGNLDAGLIAISGETNINSTDVNIAMDMTIDGALNVAESSELNILGTLTANGPQVFATNGKVTALTGGQYVAAGDITANGMADLIASGGKIVFPTEGAVVTQNVTVSVVNQGTLQVAAATAFQGGVFVTSGDINGDGESEILNTMTISGNALIELDGNITVANSGTVTVSDASNVQTLSNFFLENNGTVEFSGINFFGNSGVGTIQNNAVGQIIANSGSNQTTTIYPQVVNEGAIINIGESAALRFFYGLENQETGIVSGEGTITRVNDFSNDGSFSPGSDGDIAQILNFEGSYAQSPLANLVIDLTSYAPDDQDQLNITGTADLNGSVQVDFGSFLPQAGDEFDIISHSGSTGQISDLSMTEGIEGHLKHEVDKVQVVIDSVTPVPDIFLSDDQQFFDFRTVVVGKSDTLSFTIYNFGSADLIVSDIASTIPEIKVLNPQLTLPPDASAEVQIVFTPTDAQLYDTQLTIISNDPDEGQITIRAVGDGRLPTAKIAVDPPALDFGPTAVGTSVTLPVTVSNPGELDLVVSNILIGAGEFSVDNASFTIPEGGSLVINVSFSPSSAMVFDNSMTIVSNAVNSWAGTLPVRGIGGVPNIEASEDSIKMFNTPYTDTLVVSNTGDGPLIVHYQLSEKFVILDNVSNPFVVDPGTSRRLIIHFSGYFNGTYFDNLILNSNDPDRPLIEVPIVARVLRYELSVTPTFIKLDASIDFTDFTTLDIANRSLEGTRFTWFARIFLESQTGNSPQLLHSGDNSFSDSVFINIVGPDSGTIAPGDSGTLTIQLNSLSTPDTTYRAIIEITATPNEDTLLVPVLLTVVDSGLVAIEPPEPMPQAFELGYNYPNPFNPETTIPFRIPDAAIIRLDIYNVLGQRVKTLLDGRFKPGTHTVVWDGRDQQGNAVASGIYFLRFDAKTVRSEQYVKTGKMMLIK